MSLLKETLESGKFAVTAEMAPPKGTDLSHLIKCARAVKGRVHAVNVTDFQSAVMRTTSLTTCKLLKDEGLEPVLQVTGRDRNRIAIQGELLSAGVFGIKNMLALTGDHTIVGDHPQAKPVFDLDCVGILKTAQKLSQGTDMVGNQLKGAPEFYLGASVTPRYTPIEVQLLKMKKKINAGAEFFQTQAVYDIDTMRDFRRHTKDMNTKVLAGIIPLKSPGMAKFMNANVPGIYVPEELIDRLKSVGKENWVNEGIKIAGELIKQLKEENLCDGIHIMAIGAEENIPAILDAANI
ncbi:5 [[Clostridium] sordellii]|uniref:Methylenetetrahydrofolate reductase n=1 Tax=Paraclostridium sordellii TaxID=1505 RepID=A0ABM9RSG5_PARSO|nr:methylenetetrahydrofolate reductase [Paeniclostridium sordellii]CEJ75010.1 5,10-methylenetetrahydrofolate reductase [[Clostridium] sordellii] [Paeniclostridium sordellii]CEN70778.1 5 [[Clostridium] sordellii] [Paeniclostridium sordellii]CEN74080.1 5 [[Clostridium] sordellii] [Paeniclostridium sordellii]CEO29877.1 5 [[Clostridium] sordellii] [Paeniclostridium sordellii]CEP65660.1 5 [[Clostridium] sordellii] [Paeniclostridium sordellii]